MQYRAGLLEVFVLMSIVQLTFGCGPSDKVTAIFDGRVRIEGCELSCFPIGPEEAFHRAFANQDFRPAKP